VGRLGREEQEWKSIGEEREREKEWLAMVRRVWHSSGVVEWEVESVKSDVVVVVVVVDDANWNLRVVEDVGVEVPREYRT
jgi:hypothetical protein